VEKEIKLRTNDFIVNKDDRDPVLEVKDLNIFRSDALILKDVNFTIHKGDYVGIVGPNGGGKTTLLLTILGILPRQRGKIFLFGEDIEFFSHWEKVAYVPQGTSKFDSHFPLTVKELITLGRLNRSNLGRQLKKEDKEIIDNIIKFMGLDDIEDKRIGHLSGGQKQRVFLAKALVRKPEIIFLDEPVTGVDATAQEAFYKKLSDLNIKKNITILVVSHDLSAVFCRMSKIMCINRNVYTAEITEGIDPNTILRKVYGEHFHFVFHRHECKRVFDNA
jgi:zinc transport system ATP-binding protein